MKNNIQFLLDNYLNDSTNLIDSNAEYYKKFVKEIPQYLYSYFDDQTYLIKGSCGAGQKSEIPWICIYNKDVTQSATYGIYISYLVKSDMSGFYLTIGQGITTFEEKFGKEKYKNAMRVADYFRNLISDEKFSRDYINLNGSKSLAKGYEACNVISKHYQKGKYTDKELINDLLEFKKIYDEICINLTEHPYSEIIDNAMNYTDPTLIIAKDADELIEKVLVESSDNESNTLTSLTKIEIPNIKKNKYSVITKKIVKKTDYVKKVKKNAENGLIGEQLVMEYEKEKLRNLDRNDLADKINWVSKQDDGTGYDIISYNVDENGVAKEIYIEVKTTEGREKNVFYISTNEINVMEKLKNIYYIYRVIDVKTNDPKVFILDYEEFKNRINLCVDSYRAELN